VEIAALDTTKGSSYTQKENNMKEVVMMLNETVFSPEMHLIQY
jgi:hypothetical protein